MTSITDCIIYSSSITLDSLFHVDCDYSLHTFLVSQGLISNGWRCVI